MQAEIISDSWKVRLKLLRRDFKRHQNILRDIIEEREDEENSDEENKEQEQETESLIDQICTIGTYLEEINTLLVKTESFILRPETIRRISFLETEYYEMIISEETAEKMNQVIDWNERMETVLRGMEPLINEMWDDNKSEEEIKSKIFGLIKPFYNNEDTVRTITDNIYNVTTFEKNQRVTLSEKQIQGFQRKGNVDGGTCGICLCDIVSNEEVLTLQPKCSHIYHPDCIIPWLKRSVHCPSCRIDLR
jgi:hypothetical protein